MMSVKREYSSSVEPSDSASHTLTRRTVTTSSTKSKARPKSPRTPKKAKVAQSSASDNDRDDQPSSSSKGRPGAKARISAAVKSAMAVEIINAGIASMDTVVLADKVSDNMADET